jgi:antitoxin ParD1/3/4
MGKNTSVSLGEHFEEFVQYRIKEGRYKNVSEVIRAGLRLLEAEEQKFYALRSAIEEGIDSGIATDFEPNEFLEQIKKERKMNG